MKDVTAVILTIGEETTPRAIESVKAQTLQPCDMIIIAHVTPFHQAMIQAVQKVRSAFFVQVDSDMILDPECFATLRKCMEPGVGTVVGLLRDPLLQRITGIKMYRTACFRRVTFQNSISPDTDLGKAFMADGWTTVRALNYSLPDKVSRHTFGEHLPTYSPFYAYSKFILKGRRYRYRGRVDSCKGMWLRLQKSNTQVALIAQIALAHGIFSQDLGDGLKPYLPNEEWESLERFFQSETSFTFSLLTIGVFFFLGVFRPFKAFYRLGSRLRKANAFGTFLQIINVLGKLHLWISWTPLVALAHGALSSHPNAPHCKQSATVLKQFNACEEPVGILETIDILLVIVRSQIAHFVKNNLSVKSLFSIRQGDREIKDSKTSTPFE